MRAYIDCTLVQVDNSSNKEEQVLAYTDYKTMQAMKFLVVCAPSGGLQNSSAIPTEYSNCPVVTKAEFKRLNDIKNEKEVLPMLLGP